MKLVDFLLIIHPVTAVICIFPLIGIVSYFAGQTRQKRLRTLNLNLNKKKSEILTLVGRKHVFMGRWLSGSVVGVSLLGLAYPIGENIINNRLWSNNLFFFLFILTMFAVTIAALVILQKTRQKHWRVVFATLTGIGLVILGFQDGVFRRDSQWYMSHFYFGILVTLLMIFSLAILENIYQDCSNRWRSVHIILNCLALLLFIAQGITGIRDVLEIGKYKLGG